MYVFMLVKLLKAPTNLQQEEDQWGEGEKLSALRTPENLLFLGSLFIILVAVISSWACAYAITHQIVHFRYVHCSLCHISSWKKFKQNIFHLLTIISI